MRNHILQIDTSTPVCSVAISLNGKTVAQAQAEGFNRHAAALTHLISEMMDERQLTYEALAAIAVSRGPGSYTGLRIGVSVAKGLCYAANLPLVAVDSLRMLAEGFMNSGAVLLNPDTLLCPMIDARRMEVYQAIYQPDGSVIKPTMAAIIDESAFDWLEASREIYLFGSGADKFEDLFRNDSQVRVVPEFKASATFLSSLAYSSYQNADFEDLAYFEPLYLKDFVPTTPKKRPF